MTKKKETTEETNKTAEENADPTAFEVFFDHQRKAAEQAGKALEGLVPTAIREHGSAAFKEMVEGYRQLFNAALDQVVDRIEKAKVDDKDGKDGKK